MERGPPIPGPRFCPIGAVFYFKVLLAATFVVSVVMFVFALLTLVWTFVIAVVTAVKLLSMSVFIAATAVPRFVTEFVMLVTAF